MSRFTTARIAASRVRVGTVLYNGGRVTAVRRASDGRVIVTHQWGSMSVLPNYRFTYYPNLSR